MVYNVIMVDTSNLFYRLKKNLKNSIDIIKKMINYVDSEIVAHLHKDGEIYFLFDPISYSDLGETKNFYVPLNNRKELLSDYKANRTYSPLFLETIDLFRKYYLYRGDKIKLLFSQEYEADDYVETLIEKYKDSKIALITQDHDFSRYITDTIHMINEGFDKPFTKEEFKKLYQFRPTNATVVMFKSFFGDSSDHIQGIIYTKKARFSEDIKILCRNYLQYIDTNNYSLDDVVNEFKQATFNKINNKKDKNEFDMLYLSLALVDLKTSIFSKLYTNIQIIKSALAGKDITPYLHCNPINLAFNDVIHKSIYGIPMKQLLGKL